MGQKSLAFALIDHAVRAGADAVKFQAYDPHDLAPYSMHDAYRLRGGAWQGRMLHELYAEARTPWEWFPDLVAACEDAGVRWFASVFSPTGLQRMVDLGMERVKVASAEAVWPELLEAVAGSGLPVVVSDGVATDAQMLEVVDMLGDDITELRCVSRYPADVSDYGLSDLRRVDLTGFFYWRWGVSMHIPYPNVVPVVATVMGASMVEAHLMLPNGRTHRPLDWRHSMVPAEFATMVAAVRAAHGVVTRDRTVAGTSVGFKRRLVWAKDMRAGETVGAHDVVCMRAGSGLEPWDAVKVPGRVLVTDVEQWEPVQEEHYGGQT